MVHEGKFNVNRMCSNITGLSCCFQAREFGDVPEENWEYDDYWKLHPEVVAPQSPEKEPAQWEDEFTKRRGQYSTSVSIHINFTFGKTYLVLSNN